ncbi:MAG: Choline-sulfatase [bacterium ADurb.Bin429]|nr:MAG: Choline-sulfatase [bacterium ADurb.Bin429]
MPARRGELANMPTHPNLILFMPETVRADAVFGPEGKCAFTPHLDALITEGGAFPYTFSQSPFCAPSRCCLATGQYPHTGGYRAFSHLVQPHEWNAFRELREAGYYTVAFGKNDMLAQGAVPLSFDEVDLRVKPEDYGQYTDRRQEPKHRYSFYQGKREGPCHDTDWACIESALQFLDETHDRPFCLFLPLAFAHPTYVVEEPYYSLHDRASLPPPLPYRPEDKRRYVCHLHESHGLGELMEDDLREIRAVYYGMISRVDAQLGQIVSRLRERGLYENTALFYFSDHGDYTGDYGLTEKWNAAFEDAMLRVPLACRIPGFPATGVHNGLVEIIDLYATIMDVAGIQPRHPHFGCSLMPALRGEEFTGRDAVFAEAGLREDENGRHLPPIPDDSIYALRRDLVLNVPGINTRAAMARTERYKYVYCPGDRDELYDLRTDPGELMNRADDPALSAVRVVMKERLLRWLLETSDLLPYESDSRGWR